MDEDVIELIDELITHSKQSSLEQKNKDSVVNRLGVLKNHSISASSRQLIQKYLGVGDPEPSSIFIMSGVVFYMMVFCAARRKNSVKDYIC